MKTETHLDSQKNLLTVRVPGDLTSTTVEALRAEVNHLLEWPHDQPLPWQTLKLDLSSAKMVDSAGLNLIVAVLRAVKEAGGQMQVIYGNPNVHRTLLFTRLDRQVGLVSV
jgi:anti-anti-sigma factor